MLELIYTLPAIFIALSFHEFAHAWAAYRLGDDTASLMGRLTLDPISHIDPFGLLCLLVTRRFGWAKPVPVNPNNFKDSRKGMMWVSLAGPVMNFMVAFITLLVTTLIVEKFGLTNQVMIQVLINIYSVNVGIGIFNLIPLPPLDGSKILAGFLPTKIYWKFLEIERYSQIIMLVLIFTNATSYILNPLYNVIESAMFGLVNIIL